MYYAKVLRDSILDEIAGVDYNYNESDRVIFEEMLKEINEFTGMEFRYLAELDLVKIEGIGEIVSRYITEFNSEFIKAILISFIVSDKVKGGAELIYKLYLIFKHSEEYISAEGEPAPAHIYVRYDNAFKRLKPKRLKSAFIELAHDLRDAFYLPFTMRMLASWKIPEMQPILFSFFDDSKITGESVGIKENGNYYPSIEYMKRELKFTALDGLKYYPSQDTIRIVQKYIDEEDRDIKIAAQKTRDFLSGKV